MEALMEGSLVIVIAIPIPQAATKWVRCVATAAWQRPELVALACDAREVARAWVQPVRQMKRSISRPATRRVMPRVRRLASAKAKAA